MKVIINIDEIKSHIDNLHVGTVVFDNKNLGDLTVDGKQIWHPCYKGHTWSDASYKWADDFSTSAATRH